MKNLLNKIDLENLTNKKLVELFPDMTMQQRYNLMETKLNEYLSLKVRGGHISIPAPKEQILNEIHRITQKLPTQTVRSSAKDKLQQFSTPLQLAYFMMELLDPQPDDIVLDPSAGTGNLLTFIKGKVKQIYANEIDPARMMCLVFQGYTTTQHNAEFMHNLLPDTVKPNKIIMNPPFSSGLKVSKNKTEYGFKHLTQALYRLQAPGKLVCMLGESCMNHASYWHSIHAIAGVNILKNYSVDRKEYYKNGTSYGTNIIVIERTTTNVNPNLSINTFFNPEIYSTNTGLS